MTCGCAIRAIRWSSGADCASKGHSIYQTQTMDVDALPWDSAVSCSLLLCPDLVAPPVSAPQKFPPQSLPPRVLLLLMVGTVSASTWMKSPALRHSTCLANRGNADPPDQCERPWPCSSSCRKEISNHFTISQWQGETRPCVIRNHSCKASLRASSGHHCIQHYVPHP